MSLPRRILHCLRAPVGGLFRHVCDLARGQAALGLEVGIVCDASTGGDAATRALLGMSDICSLGVHRIPMPRQPGIGDWLSLRQVTGIAKSLQPDILHGHGAKGGAYARLAGQRLKAKGARLRTVYTPHGGSLHYSPGSLAGRLYLGLERRLGPLTDGLIFESEYAARVYESAIGPFPCPVRVVHNGLYPYEFYEAEVDPAAADFVFIGELRMLKGVDVLLEALSLLKPQAGEPAPRLVVVGGGSDGPRFQRLAKRLKIARQVTFAGPQPARIGFAKGRCVVVPSRSESLPYVVLEAVAAQMPLIATHVGGIPEIMAGVPSSLVPPDDVPALAEQMDLFLKHPALFAERAAALQSLAQQRFSIAGMTEQIVGFYSTL